MTAPDRALNRHPDARPARRVLVVDLESALVRSDIGLEGFWQSFATDWRTPLSVLGGGKTPPAPDATALPYDDEVIAYARTWRAEGGRVILRADTDPDIARAVAAHLGLFDDVHTGPGPEGEHTLLAGPGLDAQAWRAAGRAVTVNAPDTLRAEIGRQGTGAEHLTTRAPSLVPYVKALRPHQWLKNVLVFLPMITAHQLGLVTILQSLLAFAAFSIVASSVYVLNDLLDLAADRAHPRKHRRPLASGALPIRHGTWMAPGLLAAGFVLALPLGLDFVLVMLGYFAATLAYSLVLKRHVLIDIATLAGLYTIRIVAGGAATGIPLSVWLLAFSIFFFFSLAAVKRQAELVDASARGKLTASGRGYRTEDLPLVSQMAISAGYVSVLVMALYLNSPAVEALYDTPQLMWGICPVILYWVSRMVIVTHRGQMHDDPIVYAVKDRVSQICLVLILGFVLAATYA